jgi:hypothetical protein
MMQCDDAQLLPATERELMVEHVEASTVPHILLLLYTDTSEAVCTH